MLSRLRASPLAKSVGYAICRGRLRTPQPSTLVCARHFQTTRAASLARDLGLDDLRLRYADLKEIEAGELLNVELEHSWDIFVNNRLNLNRIKVYGFDYDFTLAQYNRGGEGRVQEILYEACVKYLMDDKKFPKEIANMKPDWDFGVRGLHLDVSKGNLLKMDMYNRVRPDSVFCGRRRLAKEEVYKMYTGTHAPHNHVTNIQGKPRFDEARFHHLHNLFSLAEVALITNVMEYFTNHINNCNSSSLIVDIYDAVAKAHSSGVLHGTIKKDIAKYLAKDPEIRLLLETLRENGKTVAMITNSSFDFVDVGMRFMVGDDWRQFFQVIVTEARKPDFYTQEFRPFRQWDVDNACPMWENVEEFKPGCVYQGGTLKRLLKMTTWQPWEMLYFGDDVYSDLEDPILHNGIRTGCITPELEDEIRVCNSDSYIAKARFLRGLQQIIEHVQAHHGEDPQAQALVQRWGEERDAIILELRAMFNDQFGSMFRTAQIPSYSFNRIARFADIYTSSITNLLHYVPKTVFFPQRTPLPHEAQIREGGIPCPLRDMNARTDK